MKKVIGSCHSTNPKPSLNNTLILQSESQKFIILEVQLKYYKVIQYISTLAVVILSSFVIYIGTNGDAIKAIEFQLWMRL